MLDKKYIKKIKKDMLQYSVKRRIVINLSNDALHYSKRAIFAMHRGDNTEANKKMMLALQIFKEIDKKFKNDNRIFNEGSYKAALEEYIEAVLFNNFINHKSIGQIQGLAIKGDVYIAGLCDVPGEIYRYAIKAATDKDGENVKYCAQVAQEIVGELIEFNLTSYLRTKFDQAKIAVQKIEHVVYELSLKD